MLIYLRTSEAEATLDSNQYPIPPKGGIVEWEMNQRGLNPLPNGRYRVDEVVWHFGLNAHIIVYMTPTA